MLAAVLILWSAGRGLAADPSDPIIDLFLQKGFITEKEASKAKEQIQAMRTNDVQQIPPVSPSKWIFSEKLKNVELFGDIRVRYEDRKAVDPAGGRINLQRYRYAVRLGLRGEAFDDFYYGLRLDTSSNPRSSWVTAGTSSGGTSYGGPYGKSTATIAISQAYLGYHWGDWLDLTVGKMPNPLFTTGLVWDPDINPEGLAEKLQYSVGDATFFATFGQFIYADLNPASASGGLGFNGLIGQETHNIFQLAWQTGLKYQFTTNISAKVAASVYQYVGLQRTSLTNGTPLSPYFGDPYVGEGAFQGNAAGPHLGASGYGAGTTLPGVSSVGFPLNQVGLNSLTVVEIPFEVKFKLHKLETRLFGDVAYNLDGRRRAEEAAQAYATWLANQVPIPPVKGFAPQLNEALAWQLGVAVGSKTGWAARHPWEVSTFWQHTEQYAVDPNLNDSDVFEGRGNLEGMNIQVMYGFTPNFITTVRYAYANRINRLIGTGGSNLDIPQMNPIDRYSLLQLDLSFRF